MEEQRQKHQIVLKNREKVIISGAAEVDSFDEHRVVLITELGVLLIKGSGLHIQSLNVESGDVSVQGHIDSVDYIEAQSQGGSFWSKFFK